MNHKYDKKHLSPNDGVIDMEKKNSRKICKTVILCLDNNSTSKVPFITSVRSSSTILTTLQSLEIYVTSVTTDLRLKPQTHDGLGANSSKQVVSQSSRKYIFTGKLVI